MNDATIQALAQKLREAADALASAQSDTRKFHGIREIGGEPDVKSHRAAVAAAGDASVAAGEAADALIRAVAGDVFEPRVVLYPPQA